MLNNKRVLGSIAAIAAVLVIVTFGMMYYPAAFRVPYSAILTTTGEFYVGYIFHWPFSSTLRLSDVYVLHNVKDAKTNETRPQLMPMATESLWQPKAMYFNRKNVVFTGHVGKSSQIGTALANAASATQPQAPAN